MLITSSKSSLTAHNRILIVFVLVLTIFVMLTIVNEVFDLPHYLFGDQPTSFAQRKGELITEIFMYFVVLLIAYYFFNKRIKKEVKILEGFIPVCANCKKIKHEFDWKLMEEYISENSLAKFTHSICPDCIRQLYPEFADKILSDKKDPRVT